MPKAIYHSVERFLETKFLILPLIAILYWACFQIYSTNQFREINGFIFAILLAMLAMIAAIFSLIRSYEWESTKSYLGTSLLFIAFGLFAWSFGQILYIFSSFDEAFEGFYDYIFVLIDPFYLIGIYFVAKSLNTFKNLATNIKIIVIPFLIFLINAFLVSLIRNEEVIKAVSNFDFNLFFIFGSITLSTLVVSILILSGKKIGGKFKSALYLILVGLVFQYIADNLFEISTTFEQNGSLTDLIFFLSILFIFYGIVKLNPRSLK